MTSLWVILVFGFISIEVYGVDQRDSKNAKQYFLPSADQYQAGLYDFNFLNPQQPSPAVPQYNLADPRDARYQPQFLFYGGGPVQPFLVNPVAPPNNFLYPQPGVIPQGAGVPGVVYRNSPPNAQPGGPAFGLPSFPGAPNGIPNQRPGFVPPIEKDAEEVPTNPARIPPFKPKKPVGKPEKIETFNEGPTPNEDAGIGNPNVQARTPDFINQKPGHRYFVLNGQPLFNYPFTNYQPQGINSEDNFKYANFPQTRPQEVPVPVIPALQNPIYQNPQAQNPNFQNPILLHPNFQNPALYDGIKRDQLSSNVLPTNYAAYIQDNLIGPAVKNPLNIYQPVEQGLEVNAQQLPESVNQQGPSRAQLYVSKGEELIPLAAPKSPSVVGNNLQQQADTGLFRTVVPLNVSPSANQRVKIRFSTKDFNLQPIQSPNSEFPEGAENDAVVIDAKVEDSKKENEETTSPPKKVQELSLSQAGPSATAIAGVGGVAAAGPKGTAFAGKGGMAVSSPKATAIAGPDEEKEKEEVSVSTEEDSKKEKEKRERYIRQRFRGRYQ